MGKMTPMAPASSTGLTSQWVFHGTRTMGAARRPCVAAIMACTDWMSMGPCSMSMKSQSKPAPASTWVVFTLGMVTSMPMAGLPASRHAFSGLWDLR